MLRFTNLQLICVAMLSALATRLSAQTDTAHRAASRDPIHPIGRSDDGRVRHGVGMALDRSMESAMPVSVSRHPGEGNGSHQCDVAAAAKADLLVAFVNRVDWCFDLLVTRAGIDDATPGAVSGMNTDGELAENSTNRQGELDAPTAGRFRDAARA